MTKKIRQCASAQPQTEPSLASIWELALDQDCFALSLQGCGRKSATSPTRRLSSPSKAVITVPQGCPLEQKDLGQNR